MSSKNNRWLQIEVNVKASDPQLLAGLEAWLNLGLLNDTQIRQLSQKYLTCSLPTAVASTTASVPPVAELSTLVNQQLASSETKVREPNWLTRMLQSLQAELSVRWLLFLGVFMVVMSSGVLAASQWQKFPAAGQYGILFGYTLIFWGIGYWASWQNNLRLTAQTLQIVTLLLVPLNFWTMDGFGLWDYYGGWLTIAIATAIMTAMVKLYGRQQAVVVSSQQSPLPLSLVGNTWLLLLGLSYLHWGWRFSGFPLIAVYLGIAATIVIFYPKRRMQHSLTTGNLLVVYAIVVLLFRAIFVAGVNVEQLGLAIGACGVLLSLLSQQSETPAEPQFSWEWLGAGLLFLGWLAAVGEVFPWQALVVSGLGLWFFASRLQRFWQRLDLFAFLCIGLQAIWLMWRLIPPATQQQLVAQATQITGSLPSAILSLILFPYCIFILGLADWLYRQQKPHLAKFGELLALGLGAILTSLSLSSPKLRSLNLLFSTVTLFIVTQRRVVLGITSIPQELGYLTQITALLTIISTINYLLPNLNLGEWAGVLIILMVIEWGLCLKLGGIWQRSAWNLGLLLAAVSYQLLLINSYFISHINFNLTQHDWGLLWLITPIALTALTNHINFRISPAWLSVAALGLAQILTWELPSSRLISLGIAASLMLVNTRYLQQIASAVITVGFSLSFLGTLLWEGIPGFARLSTSGWFIFWASAVTSLWIINSLVKSRSSRLAQIYASATDGWALALSSCELILLTIHLLTVYSSAQVADINYLIAEVVLIGAIVYRSWQQPTNLVLYSIGWAIELLVAEGIYLNDRDILKVAIANTILGYITLILGEWWLLQQHRFIRNNSTATIPSLNSSLQILPLLYAGLSLVLRLDYFTAWTGLLTLGAALIGIGVGRRVRVRKPLVYLSLIGISLAWYELVIYQLSQDKAGNPADGLIILAIVAGVIAFTYRLLAQWLQPYLRLSVAEIAITAHIHWAIGSGLMVIALSEEIEKVSHLVGVGIAISLLFAVYALLQGRSRPTTHQWVYLGLLEILGTGVSIRLIWTQLSVIDPWVAIIACGIAGVIFILPWTNWGWDVIPWKRSAIVFPVVTVLATSGVINSISLLVVAGFYIWIAFQKKKVLFTYISLALIDWWFIRWISHLQFTDLLWYSTPIGLSLLYIAQIDPGLKSQAQRQPRHNLRLLGTSAICLVALVINQWHGLLPGSLSLLAIFIGIALRVRAFLYIGTATFLADVFYQLVILIFDYSFAKWIIGLIVGITFIWIAANFETRREQITVFLRNWISDLQTWE